jgi:hypothetical protein
MRALRTEELIGLGVAGFYALLLFTAVLWCKAKDWVLRVAASVASWAQDSLAERQPPQGEDR